MNAHQEPAYADNNPANLPHSEKARDAVIELPLFPDMSLEDVNYVLDTLKSLA